MHDTLTTPLPASWLVSRLGIRPAEIDRLRERGELFGAQHDATGEWFYPAWQFGPGGEVPPGVRAVVRVARSLGITEERLVSVLRRRAGLMGGGRLFDLLFEGRADSVVEAVRSLNVAQTIPG